MARSLKEELMPRTVEDLPSTRTESLLYVALESDDIEVVKANLTHVWLHYQSLELAVANAANVEESLEELSKNPAFDQDLPPFSLAARFFSSVVILNAYELAHRAGAFARMLDVLPTIAVKEMHEPGSTETMVGVI